MSKTASKAVFVLSLLMAGSGAVVSASAAESCKPVTMQVNHEMGVGTPTARALEWFGKQVTKETEGAVRFRYFHTHQLGSERETYDMLQSGSIQMGVSGAQIISALAPEYGALLLPYAFANADHFARVLDGPVGENMHSRFLEQKGIRILGWAHRAPRHLTTSNRKVHSPDDMKGLKTRIRQIPVQIDAFRELGASPVPMAFPEVYTALQTGVIDAQENPASIMAANSFAEVQKYLILTAHIREAFWWEVSERVWQSMCPQFRTAFEKNISGAIQMSNKLESEEDADYIRKLGAKGMTIIDLTDDQRAVFASKMPPVAAKYSDQWKDGLYQKIVELR